MADFNGIDVTPKRTCSVVVGESYQLARPDLTKPLPCAQGTCTYALGAASPIVRTSKERLGAPANSSVRWSMVRSVK